MDPVIIETATVAMATFFATIGPLDVAAVYAALTATETPKRRRRMGDSRHTHRNWHPRAICTGGRASTNRARHLPRSTSNGRWHPIAALIGIDMVFARTSGSTSTTEEEEIEAMGKRDIAVFPLATPLIAGPGAMGAVILLMANSEGNLILQATVVASLLVIILLTFINVITGIKNSTVVWE